MRGAAMKVGQTLSAVDLGLVPEEIRPQFQEILAHAPAERRAGLVQGDPQGGRGRPRRRSSATCSPTSSRSRSPRRRSARCTARRCDDGRTVAVKVQYPGIAEAIHADMQNLRLGLKLLSVIAPGIDTGEIADEIRERISRGARLRARGRQPRRWRARTARHPFIVVPDVVTRAVPRACDRVRVRRRRSASRRSASGRRTSTNRIGRDPDPLLPQRAAPPPAAERRPPPRQLAVPGRRARRVPRLRVLQATVRRGGHAAARVHARDLRERRRRAVRGDRRPLGALPDDRALARAVPGDLPGDLRLAAGRRARSRSTAR